jgi:MFS family permease
VASSYSTSFNMLFVMRVFVGFAIGGGHNCVTLLTEYVPKAKRGIFFFFNENELFFIPRIVFNHL